MIKTKKSLNLILYLVGLFLVLDFKIYSNEKISLEFNYANLNGTANEIVYWSSASDKKISELVWELDNVKLIGIDTSYNPNENIRLNLNFYTNFSTGKSEMTDYDWTNYYSNDWTHWSNSPTDINGVYKLDLNLQYTAMVRDYLGFFIITGYKVDIYKWVANGGEYVYPSESGTFDDVPVISYNQYFNVPYIGVGAIFEKANFTLVSKLIYSSAVTAKDEDTHHLRDLYFEEYFDNGEMAQINIKGKYSLTDNFEITGAFDYTEYYNNKGYIIETDLTDGSTTTYSEGSAGIENNTSIISLGFNYKF